MLLQNAISICHRLGFAGLRLGPFSDGDCEFERLLEEVARGDRGQVVARTYLTSETGKVYTMLAHAAGRFGNE